MQNCPALLPPEIENAARALARAYVESEIRPRLVADVLSHWDDLIDEWAESDLPLFVRKQRNDIGKLLEHEATGRQLAPCDNSPAHWAIVTAFDEGCRYTLKNVKQALDRHEIPVTMAMSNEEIVKAKMKGVLAKMKMTNAGTYGWKVDHIYEIGLKQRGRIEELQMGGIKDHFKALMKPSNIVLVPKVLKGLGDMPAFLDVIKREASQLSPLS